MALYNILWLWTEDGFGNIAIIIDTLYEDKPTFSLRHFQEQEYQVRQQIEKFLNLLGSNSVMLCHLRLELRFYGNLKIGVVSHECKAFNHLPMPAPISQNLRLEVHLFLNQEWRVKEETLVTYYVGIVCMPV